MEEVQYLIKRNKLLPFLICFILVGGGSISIKMFATPLFLGEGAVYAIPLLWLAGIILFVLLSKGELEVTNLYVRHKAGKELIGEIKITDITNIEITEEESVVSGPSRGKSASYYLYIAGKEGEQLKIDCTAFSRSQLDQAIHYIETQRQT